MLGLIDTARRSEEQDLKRFAERVGLDAARDFVGTDISGIDFRGRKLTGFNFSGADLSGADLRETGITPSQLIGANLTNAQMDDEIAAEENKPYSLLKYADVAYSLLSLSEKSTTGPKSSVLELIDMHYDAPMFFVSSEMSKFYADHYKEVLEWVRARPDVIGPAEYEVARKARASRAAMSLRVLVAINDVFDRYAENNRSEDGARFRIGSNEWYVVDGEHILGGNVVPSWYSINRSKLEKSIRAFEENNYNRDYLAEEIAAQLSPLGTPSQNRERANNLIGVVLSPGLHFSPNVRVTMATAMILFKEMRALGARRLSLSQFVYVDRRRYDKSYKVVSVEDGNSVSRVVPEATRSEHARSYMAW